jgi:chromosome segregation ATPase
VCEIRACSRDLNPTALAPLLRYATGLEDNLAQADKEKDRLQADLTAKTTELAIIKAAHKQLDAATESISTLTAANTKLLAELATLRQAVAEKDHVDADTTTTPK